METPSESDWMKGIDNQTVCTFFWYYFVAFAIYSVVNIGSAIYTISKLGVSSASSVFMVLLLVLISLVTITGTLFHYLICDRLIVA